MAINPNIALGVTPVAIKTPGQARMERLKIQDAERGAIMDEQAIAGNAAKLREAQMGIDANKRKQEGVAVLSELMANYGDQHDEITKGLAQRGYGDLVSSYETMRRANELAKLTNEDKQLETASKKNTMFGQLLNTVKDQPSFYVALGQAVQNGFIQPEQAQQIGAQGWTPETEAQVKQLAESSMTIEKQLSERRAAIQEARAKQLFEEVTLPSGKQDVVAKTQKVEGKEPIQPYQQATLSGQEADRKQRAADAAAARATTERGQNMTAEAAANRLKYGQDGKPPNASERRVFSFYERAKNAEDVLDSLADQMADKGLLAQGVYRFAPNVAQSEDNQVYRQAQRQFTEARLRKDSGAAINPKEYENDEKTYFPQPGDTKKTIERKASARASILQALYRESGKAAAEMGAETPAKQGGAKPAEKPVRKYNREKGTFE